MLDIHWSSGETGYCIQSHLRFNGSYPRAQASRVMKSGLSVYIYIREYGIREYGSTLYVGLARAVSPTNTNFRLTFLLTRLEEALYEDLAV